MPWFLGPSGNVQSDPSEPVLAQPVNLEQVCKKGGGGDGGIAPGNRLLATDHGLTGFPDLKVNPGLGL